MMTGRPIQVKAWGNALKPTHGDATDHPRIRVDSAGPVLTVPRRQRRSP
jgi:hypothetical protein